VPERDIAVERDRGLAGNVAAPDRREQRNTRARHDELTPW